MSVFKHWHADAHLIRLTRYRRLKCTLHDSDTLKWEVKESDLPGQCHLDLQLPQSPCLQHRSASNQAIQFCPPPHRLQWNKLWQLLLLPIAQ